MFESDVKEDADANEATAIPAKGSHADPSGYQGSDEEIERVADVLLTIAATPDSSHFGVLALRSYFPFGAWDVVLPLLKRWVATCQPDHRHIPARPLAEFERRWREDWQSEPGPPVTLSELLARLRALTRDAGSPIRWPDPKSVMTPEKPIAKSRANVAAALNHLGVVVYKDEFSLRFMVTGLRGFSEINDEAMRALWFKAQALGLDTSKDFFTEAILDIARADLRHPVRDYLADVERKYRERVGKSGEPKPGKALIETLLIKRAGAEDTDLNRAFTRKWLIAAVRRIRQPGAKFDQMLVLESPQGRGKSTFAKTLASPQWFEENLRLGASAQEVIQQTAGKWVVEIAELMGLSVKETEAVKQMISRTHDRWALKYDKWATDAPRQFVLIGTTNDAQYLRDKTGNRRFWPIRVTREISEAKVRQLRDHLWGEAAYYEAKGESVELPRGLWDDAAVAQAEREIVDPIEEMLSLHLADRHGKLLLDDLWTLAGVPADDPRRKDQALRTRIGAVMARLGWDYDRNRKLYHKAGLPGSAALQLVAVGAPGSLRLEQRPDTLFGAAVPPKVVKFISARRAKPLAVAAEHPGEPETA